MKKCLIVMTICAVIQLFFAIFDNSRGIITPIRLVAAGVGLVAILIADYIDITNKEEEPQ